MRMAWVSAVLVILSGGCAVLQDAHYSCRNALRTECAWLSAAPNRLLWIVPSDYGRGWKQGYYSMAMGGAGKAPTLPPTRYWSPRYQSPEGQAAVADWYEGFQHGTIVADMRGAGRYHYLRPAGCPCPPYQPEVSPAGVPPQPDLPGELSAPRVPPETLNPEPVPPAKLVTPPQDSLPIAPLPPPSPETAPVPAAPTDASAVEASHRTAPIGSRPTLSPQPAGDPASPSIALLAILDAMKLTAVPAPSNVVPVVPTPPMVVAPAMSNIGLQPVVNPTAVASPIAHVSKTSAAAAQAVAVPQGVSTPTKTAARPVREAAAQNTRPQDACDLRSRSTAQPLTTTPAPSLRQPQAVSQSIVDADRAAAAPTIAKSSRRTAQTPWVDNLQPLTATTPMRLAPVPQPASPHAAATNAGTAPSASPPKSSRRMQPADPAADNQRQPVLKSSRRVQSPGINGQSVSPHTVENKSPSPQLDSAATPVSVTAAGDVKRVAFAQPLQQGIDSSTASTDRRSAGNSLPAPMCTVGTDRQFGGSPQDDDEELVPLPPFIEAIQPSAARQSIPARR